MIGKQEWYPVRPEFRCQQHGVVEPTQVTEEVREFKNCTMTVVRMQCPICCVIALPKDDEQGPCCCS